MSEATMAAYQLKSDPSVIVKAVQFKPHEHPWPDGVISWDGKPRPRDGSFGYIETSSGKYHVMASDYILDDCFGDKRVIRCSDFEKAYRPVIVLGDYINPMPQGGDATIPDQSQAEDTLGQISKRYIREEMSSLINHYVRKKKLALKKEVPRDSLLDALEYEAKIEAILEIATKLGISLIVWESSGIAKD